MNNKDVVNAITVLRDVLKSAKPQLAYEVADQMLADLKKSPIYPESEIQRAFCAGFLANLNSMKDFEGDRIIKKYEAYKKSGYFILMEAENLNQLG